MRSRFSTYIAIAGIAASLAVGGVVSESRAAVEGEAKHLRVPITDAPHQVRTPARAVAGLHPAFRVVAVADFDFSALVLGSREYYQGLQAELSPVDFALAWGEMSDPDLARHLKVSQHGRFYHWSFRGGTGLAQRMVEEQSANMHMIPATARIRNRLLDIRRGDRIRVAGRLVNVYDRFDWIWRSSRTRKDVGDGACEIVLVEAIERFY